MSQIAKGHCRGPLFNQALAQIAKGDGLFLPKVDFMNDAARILSRRCGVRVLRTPVAGARILNRTAPLSGFTREIGRTETPPKRCRPAVSK
jgi:hypothetical protein